MKYIILPFLFLLCVFEMRAQQVMFESATLEHAVRFSLNIDKNSPITKAMADTVTKLSLEASDIDNVDDLLNFPMLSWLNLSHNKITNIEALKNLSKLRYLNLSYNQLETIDPLRFGVAKTMLINLTHNYLTDAISLYDAPFCNYHIIGANYQNQKENTYMVGHQLYTSIDLEGMSNLKYIFQTNNKSLDASFLFNKQHLVRAIADNYTQQHDLTAIMTKDFAKDLLWDIREGGRVLSNEVLIAPRWIELRNNDVQQALDLRLPTGYQFNCIKKTTKCGTFEQKAQTLYYTPSKNIDANQTDTLEFYYSKDSIPRGLSYVIVSKKPLSNITIIQPQKSHIIVKDYNSGRSIPSGSYVPKGVRLTASVVSKSSSEIESLVINGKKYPSNTTFIINETTEVSAILKETTGLESLNSQAIQNIRLITRSNSQYLPLVERIENGDIIRIRNINGQILKRIHYSENLENIDLRDLPTNVYLISYGRTTLKIMIDN